MGIARARLTLLRTLAACVLAGSALLASNEDSGTAAAGLAVSYPAISFLSPRLGWVLAGRGTAYTVLRTADAGRSWVRLAQLSLSVNSILSLQLVDNHHGWISTIGPSLCGDPKSPPCRTILLRTVDGGRHWSRLSAPAITGGAVTFVDPQHGWLVHSSSCRNVCLQSIYATSDGGATWHLLSAAPHLWNTTMSWVNRLDGWIGGGNPRSCIASIFATSDGGITWTRQLALPGHCGRMQVGMLDARHGWAVGGIDATRYCSMGGCSDYALYQTGNGGHRWTVELASSRNWWLPPRGYGGFPGQPRFVTTRYGWIPFNAGAGPGDGGIAITVDGGHTWRRVLGAYSLTPSAVDPITPRDGWIAGLWRLCPLSRCGADLLHTTDGGRTWTRLHPQP